VIFVHVLPPSCVAEDERRQIAGAEARDRDVTRPQTRVSVIIGLRTAMGASARVDPMRALGAD